MTVQKTQKNEDATRRMNPSGVSPVVIRRLPRCDQSAADLRRFHHQYAAAQTADDPVAFGEIPSLRRGSGWELRQQAAMLPGILIQRTVGQRIDHIRAAAQHTDHRCAGGHCP